MSILKFTAKDAQVNRLNYVLEQCEYASKNLGSRSIILPGFTLTDTLKKNLEARGFIITQLSCTFRNKTPRLLIEWD